MASRVAGIVSRLWVQPFGYLALKYVGMNVDIDLCFSLHYPLLWLLGLQDIKRQYVDLIEQKFHLLTSKAKWDDRTR